MDVHQPSSWLVLHQRSFNHHQAALFHFSLSFNIYCRNLKCQIFSPPIYRWYRWQIWGMGNALSAKRRGCICISVFFCIWTFFAFKRDLSAEGILWSQPCLWQNLNPSSGSFIRRSWCGWPPHRLIDRRRDFKPSFFFTCNPVDQIKTISKSWAFTPGENPGYVIAGKVKVWCNKFQKH